MRCVELELTDLPQSHNCTLGHGPAVSRRGMTEKDKTVGAASSILSTPLVPLFNLETSPVYFIFSSRGGNRSSSSLGVSCSPRFSTDLTRGPVLPSKERWAPSPLLGNFLLHSSPCMLSVGLLVLMM